LYSQSISKLNNFLKWIDISIWNDDLESIEKQLDDTKQDFIKSGLIFRNIKDKTINSLEDLEKVGIIYKKYNLTNMSSDEKIKVNQELISLYYENYDIDTQWNFLHDIDAWLGDMLNWNNEVEFYIFYVGKTPILSTYLKHITDKSFYQGWLNAKTNFQDYRFWFWVFSKLLEINRWKEINFTVTKEIEWKENSRYKMLLRLYERYWFYIVWEWENKYSKFLKLSNKEQVYKKVA
jgi:hypothetical protein